MVCSWKDGKAIVALWNYLITEDADLYDWLKQKHGEELTIDIDKTTTVRLSIQPLSG